MSFKLKGWDVELNVNDYVIENMEAIILCVHGMCEHSKRYEDLALFLNKKGYSVFTYDQRGHGESLLENKNLGYLGNDGFNKMVYDLNIVINYLKDKYYGYKIYLLGHSMGSFVVQRYIQIFDTVDGVILSGSNYGTKLIRLGTFLSKLACIFKGEEAKGKLIEKLSFGSYNKLFKPNRTNFDWLSRNEVEVDKYINDECCGFTCTNRFYYDFFKGLLELSKEHNFKKINPSCPILIISGEKDPVGYQGKGVKVLYNILKKYVNDVEMKLYKEARHEILNELNRNEVYNDIVNWLINMK
ncbi:MAG TPA: lysophospholipase [Haloplasmataceae bacterium]